MESLVTENITKQFVNHTALEDVSISVPEGEIYGLLGPNGAGKTTLIRIINQINLPDTGQVYINGEKLKPRHIYQIGYLPEERGLYKKMKVGEQALYLARLKGVEKHEALKKLKYWFEKFELEQWWDRKVEELSKGMQQKVQFIVTILHRPRLLIFDEPFSGFDPVNTNLLKNEVLKLKEEGSTIIFSTHNMASVEEICDKIALINKSKKIVEGPILDIKQEYKPNTFNVGFRNSNINLEENLRQQYNIQSFNPTPHGQYAKLHLDGSKSPNDLIQEMMKFGEIISFNEVLPNMDEIFIKLVEDKTEINQ